MSLTLFPIRPLFTCLDYPYVLKAYTIWPPRLQSARFHLESGSVLVTPDVVTALLLW